MDTRDPVSNYLSGGSQVSTRVAARPRLVTVSYRGMPYTLNLAKCRRALVYRQVEGQLDVESGDTLSGQMRRFEWQDGTQLCAGTYETVMQKMVMTTTPPPPPPATF